MAQLSAAGPASDSILSAPNKVVQEYPISTVLMIFGRRPGSRRTGQSRHFLNSLRATQPPTMTERLTRQLYDVLSQAVPESVSQPVRPPKARRFPFPEIPPMSTPPPTADQIQRQMQQVRTDLRENVRELGGKRREMTVWQRYVQGLPLDLLAAAALVGYVIVPTRTRLQSDPNLISEMVKLQLAQQTSSAKPSGGGIVSNLISGVAGVAVNNLLQGGVSILGKQINRFV